MLKSEYFNLYLRLANVLDELRILQIPTCIVRRFNSGNNGVNNVSCASFSTPSDGVKMTWSETYSDLSVVLTTILFVSL